MGFIERTKHVYEHEYKKLLIIPILLLLLAIGQIGYQIATTGDFVQKSVSLKGGISITTPSEIINTEQLITNSKKINTNADISVRALRNTNENIIEISGITEEQVIQLLEEQNVQREKVVIESTGSTIGKSFFKATMGALLISFILMTLVVAFSFGTFIPSLAVILAAASDIIITLAIFNLTGQKLTTAGIAAFLMLIGYSVDTDILLSTRTLKRKEGTLNERIYSSIKTGMMTTMTTIIAVLLALIIAKSETIQQIMLIILIGMFVDIINTWIQNVGILRWYIERRQTKTPETSFKPQVSSQTSKTHHTTTGGQQ